MSQENECAVCFENITDKNNCTTLCNHIFCLECILIHFQQKNNCPLCRSNLILIEKYSHNNKKIYIVNYTRSSEILFVQDAISHNSRNSNITLNNEIINDFSDDDISDLEETYLTEPI
jgi:hypothetical protein